jgi:ferrochelatase
MAASSLYREQLLASAGGVAKHAGIADWALVYQSRSGRPGDPWLEPDVCDYLREAGAAGLQAAVLCPIGFVCDHIEVLYDLDHEAAEVCRAIGLPMVRAEAANDDPRFLDMMADVVLRTVARYERGRPLTIVSRAGATGAPGAPAPHAAGR